MDRVEADYTGQEAQNLINILTTNHTYFMREPEHFEFFKNVILPELKRTGKDWNGFTDMVCGGIVRTGTIYDCHDTSKIFWDRSIMHGKLLCWQRIFQEKYWTAR